MNSVHSNRWTIMVHGAPYRQIATDRQNSWYKNSNFFSILFWLYQYFPSPWHSTDLYTSIWHLNHLYFIFNRTKNRLLNYPPNYNIFLATNIFYCIKNNWSWKCRRLKRLLLEATSVNLAPRKKKLAFFLLTFSKYFSRPIYKIIKNCHLADIFLFNYS